MARLIDTMTADQMKLSWRDYRKPQGTVGLYAWFDEMCKEMPGNRGFDKYLNDLDRGNYDGQHGKQAKEGESDAYYVGYGARYVYEQAQNHQTERGMK